jgi:hypothetical protein
VIRGANFVPQPVTATASAPFNKPVYSVVGGDGAAAAGGIEAQTSPWASQRITSRT